MAVIAKRDGVAWAGITKANGGSLGTLGKLDGVDKPLTYRSEVLADSPVAYWRLGEASGTTAADDIGSYPGTYVGSPTLGVAGALADGNTAVNLIGGSRRISCGTTVGNYTTSDFSIEFWVKGTAFTSTDAATYCYLLAKGQFNVAGWYIVAAENVLNFNTCQSGATQTSGTTTLPLNQWLHVVVTRSGSVAKIYVNGQDVTVTSGSHVNPANSSAYDFQIGNSRSLNFTPNAIFDEVAIYSFALSAADVLAHYNARNNR